MRCVGRGWCRALDIFLEGGGTKMMLKGTSLRYMLMLAALSGFSHQQRADAASVHAVGPEDIAREVMIYRDRLARASAAPVPPAAEQGLSLWVDRGRVAGERVLKADGGTGPLFGRGLCAGERVRIYQ